MRQIALRFRKLICKKVTVEKASNKRASDLALLDHQKLSRFLQLMRLNVMCCAVKASFLHYLRSEQKTEEKELAPLKCLLKN